jgi:hypothetical protein
MRTRSRPRPQHTLRLAPLTPNCPECGRPLWSAYDTRRTVTTLEGPVRLVLHVRHCPNPSCPRFHKPYRPETEPHYALPHHEFGLDVIALVGHLRYVQHRSIPEIHAELRRRRVVIAAYDPSQATLMAERSSGPWMLPAPGCFWGWSTDSVLRS